MTFCNRMSSTKHESRLLGWQIHEAAVKVLQGFDLRLGDMYVWVDEVIAEAKKTLAVEDIKLLPKTPSAKSRTRRCQRTLRSNAASNSEAANVSIEILPAKKTRRKAPKANKRLNFVGDSSMLNDISKLEDVDEEGDAQDENAKGTRTSGNQNTVKIEKAASKTSAGVCSSTEQKNAEQGKENDDETGCKTSDKLDVHQSLDSRDVLNMAAAILDGNYKASSALSSKTNPSNGYTPSSARKLFGYVKSALSSFVPNLTLGPSENSVSVQESDEANSSQKETEERTSQEKPSAPLSNPGVIKQQSASADQGMTSEQGKQNSQPLASRKPVQSSRVSNSGNGLRRSSLRVKITRLSTSKRNSKRLSIRASRRLVEAAKKSKKSDVVQSETFETKSEAIQVDMSSDEEIEDTPPVSIQVVKSKAQLTQVNKNSETSNQGRTMLPPSTEALPVRSTRARMKEVQQFVSPPAFKKESGAVMKEDAKAVGVAVTPELRCTRSKTRDLQAPSSPAIAAQATPRNNGTCATGTPSTATRSKGNKIKQLQELLCKDPGFGLKPAETAVDSPLSNTRRRSSKRQQEPGNDNEVSRAKRHCRETEKISPNQATLSASGSVEDLKNNIKGVYVSSCYAVLKRAPTPNSQGTTSILQRNTPKVLNRQEIQEVGRKTLAVKVKKMEELAQKKNEELLKKIEEQKRLREEHHISVLRRRQELEQSTVKKSKLDETSSSIKTNDREKSKIGTLRERRLAEAEQRRKQEEEARKQTLLQQEKEKQMLEEQQRRRREQEEQERQQRIAEQRRQEEERRLRQERERQEEQERLRKLELQRLREEEEKRKQKEERERKEKAERDRIELEKQQKKEKQKQLEIEKKKELERQKIAEEQARLEAEQRNLEEQQNLQKMIEKHNQTVKQNANVPSSATSSSILKTQTIASTSVVSVKCSAQTQPGSAQAQPQQTNASAKPTLNATFEKEGNAKTTTHNSCDSYEMTPCVKKPKTTSTDSNYNIDDLHSEDSTDDESQPRKKIPLWAQGNQLKIALISQFTNPPDAEKMFGEILSPDLNELFTKKRARFNKRTSSANWDEPMMQAKTNTL